MSNRYTDQRIDDLRDEIKSDIDESLGVIGEDVGLLSYTCDKLKDGFDAMEGFMSRTTELHTLHNEDISELQESVNEIRNKINKMQRGCVDAILLVRSGALEGKELVEKLENILLS